MTSGTGEQQTSEQHYNVRVERHVRIPMPDGVDLDAHLYMPDASGNFPAVFDCYPYRKDDLSAGDMRNQVYLAQRGFVGIRVDVRGTGSSGGVPVDEYTLQEQLDLVEAIAWMARQPWCNGNVGMFGASYAGFNSLQVAMHRPPALKAICPMYFSDNRYTDDCHYLGGALQMFYILTAYGLSMTAQNAMPPYPEATGTDWAAIWRDRLQAEPWLLTWLANQVENDYWQQGSLCRDYSAVDCAVYLFGGWRDGYTNSNFRTFANLNTPKKMLIGPWVHIAPDVGVPGPRIDYLHEMVRFYNYWLKGEDDGIMDEPPITVYMQEYDRPAAQRDETSGFWRFESGWPLSRAQVQTRYLAEDETLADVAPPHRSQRAYTYHPGAGTTLGMFSAGAAPVLPMDQRLEEVYATSWTSAPLEEPLEILGYPEAEITLSVDTEIASLSVRLIDVAPDGSAALVTKGLLNLTHRESHEAPEPLEPNREYTIKVPLNAAGWRFVPGHRLRVSIGGADFPNAWPSPKPYTGVVVQGDEAASCIRLPVVPEAAEALPTPQLRPPQPITPQTSGFGAPPTWRVTRDPIQGTTSVQMAESGHGRVSDRVSLYAVSDATAGVDETDPAHAWVKGFSQFTLYWPERTIDTLARAQVTSTVDTFHVTLQLDITLDGAPHHRQSWTRAIPRQLL